MTIDSYGYGGTVPEVARRASADGGRFLSFHIDMNGNGRIAQADNGTVTAFIEPLWCSSGVGLDTELPTYRVLDPDVLFKDVPQARVP